MDGSINGINATVFLQESKHTRGAVITSRSELMSHYIHILCSCNDTHIQRNLEAHNIDTP